MRSYISRSYLFQKRDVYYFQRRVPKDVQGYYKSNSIIISLKTKSQRLAQSKATQLAAQLDDEWHTLRWKSRESILDRFMLENQADFIHSSAPSLEEAEQLYLCTKGVNKPKEFAHTVTRAVRYLIQAVGNKPIDTYTRDDANAYKDFLLNRRLSVSSVKRNISVIRAMINFTAREKGIDEINIFSSLFFADEGIKQTKRQPISCQHIKLVQNECLKLNDNPRQLIALISDTGLRLSEAAGIVKTDVVLDTVTPYLIVREHPWRRLKTSGSNRLVPLVGEALRSIKLAMTCAEGEFLFPKYCDDSGVKSNSCSAALNKWLRTRLPAGCVVHSFRHSMRDRLRAVECPPDIIDRIGGWSRQGIGETYGTGYPIEVLYRWMKQIV
ncbi:MAG: DUF6538 domain-containing protein [Neptuniibacter sp.]